jgi:protein ImuB
LFERTGPREERIAPAEPTLDEVQLVDLLRLRLEALRLTDELTGFELHAEAIAGTGAVQAELFEARPRRDLAAANRALARLRAELGDTAVITAALRPGHLPEARFAWQPLARLTSPAPSASGELRLVRRVLAKPRELLAQTAHADGWFVRGLGAGPLYNLLGPYVISGGWWRREQHRDYYFAETRRGDLLWLYRDGDRRRWVLHGMVE